MRQCLHCSLTKSKILTQNFRAKKLNCKFHGFATFAIIPEWNKILSDTLVYFGPVTKTIDYRFDPPDINFSYDSFSGGKVGGSVHSEFCYC